MPFEVNGVRNYLPLLEYFNFKMLSNFRHPKLNTGTGQNLQYGICKSVTELVNVSDNLLELLPNCHVNCTLLLFLTTVTNHYSMYMDQGSAACLGPSLSHHITASNIKD